MNVTFIGMGVMGSAMANNLLNNDVKLTIWNRTKEKAEPLLLTKELCIKDLLMRR